MAGPGGLVEAREGRGWRPSGGRGHQSWDPTPLERAGGNPPGTRLDRTAPRGTAQYANPKVFPDYLEIDRPPHTHSVYQMYHPEARPKVPIGVVAASSKATSPEPERIKQSYLTPAHPGLSPAQEAAGLYYREITPAELISIFLKLPGAAQVALVRNLRAINHFRGDLGKNIDNAKWSFIGAAYNEQFYANLITQELGSQANTAVHTAAENLARKTKRAATLVTQTAKRELPKTPAYLREQLAATIRYFQNILTNPSAREQGGYFTAAQGLRAGAFATEVVTVAGCAIMPFLPLAPKSPTSASATLVECVGEDKLNAQALQDALTHEQQLVRDYGDNFAVTESHTDGSSYLDIAIRTKDGSTLPVARVAESSVDPTVTCVSLINPKATGESNNPFLVFWRKIKSKDESLVRMFQRLFGTSASDAGGEFLSAILPAASPPPDATETAASSTPTSAPDTSTPTLAPSPTATDTQVPTATRAPTPTLEPTPNAEQRFNNEVNSLASTLGMPVDADGNAQAGSYVPIVDANGNKVAFMVTVGPRALRSDIVQYMTQGIADINRWDPTFLDFADGNLNIAAIYYSAALFANHPSYGSTENYLNPGQDPDYGRIRKKGFGVILINNGNSFDNQSFNENRFDIEAAERFVHEVYNMQMQNLSSTYENELAWFARISDKMTDKERRVFKKWLDLAK